MSSVSLLSSAITTALGFATGGVRTLLANRKADSLISYTRSTRVEPIVLVDQSLINASYIQDIMQSLSSIFIGYYLQAVALSVNVNQINVIRLLDALNPNRDMLDASATRIVDNINAKPSFLSLESYETKLPTMEDFKSAHNAAAGLPNLKDFSKKASAMGATAQTAYGDRLGSVNEAVNLSVGKLIEVTVNNGEGKGGVTFPVIVRLVSTLIDTPSLTHILGDGGRQNATLRERFHSWKAGRLTFVRDLVFCQDLIDEHRAAVMNDKTGVYADILERRRNNGVSSLMSGNPTIGTASNIVVISKDTARHVEREINGKLSNYEVRQRIFDSSYVMIMAVVDTEYERVTFYHRGIKTPTDLSVKELKTSNKGTGPDVAEILKAYMLGNAPTI